MKDMGIAASIKTQRESPIISIAALLIRKKREEINTRPEAAACLIYHSVAVYVYAMYAEKKTNLNGFLFFQYL